MNKSEVYRRWDNYGERPVLIKSHGEWSAEMRLNDAPFKRKCRALIYHRASGPDDPLKGEQIAACREYCERNGFTVYETFTDTGPGPFDMVAVLRDQGEEALNALLRKKHQHPTFDKAIEAIKEGKADILVAYSPDQVFHTSVKRGLAYELCYFPPVAFVEPWQDEEQPSEEAEPSSGEELREDPIPVWIDGALMWTLPTKLPGISQEYEDDLRAVVVCYGTSADDPLVVKQKHDCWKYCVRNGYRIVRTCVEISPEERSTQTRSAALRAAVERNKADSEAIKSRPHDSSPFEMVEKREADVIVMHSPNLFVTEKKALADILWAMPPIVFTRGWQDSEEQ